MGIGRFLHFAPQRADLLKDCRQLSAPFGQVILHVRHGVIEFRPGNDTEILQFPESLIQYFFGDAGNITFEFARASDFLSNGGHNPG